MWRWAQSVSAKLEALNAPQTKRPDDWQPPERVRDPWTLLGIIYRTAYRVWDWGLTPGSVIRTLGPYGPTVIQRYARNRCL